MTKDLEEAAAGTYRMCKKFHRWLITSAKACEHNAKGTRFPGYADKCGRDAKDYRATAKHVRAAIAAYEKAKQ